MKTVTFVDTKKWGQEWSRAHLYEFAQLHKWTSPKPPHAHAWTTIWKMLQQFLIPSVSTSCPSWPNYHFSFDAKMYDPVSLTKARNKRCCPSNKQTNKQTNKINGLYNFRVCKSVHHHTFKWINQLDAAISQVYYLSFKYSSTCFGHPHAHHQELQQLQ